MSDNKKKNILEIKYDGIAECIYEPRGRGELEGFVQGFEYKYIKSINTTTKKPYYQLWIGEEGRNNYWESCNSISFKKFFSIKKITYPGTIFFDGNIDFLKIERDKYVG